MSWRKITEPDLVATLSLKEVSAFRKNAEFDGDPVEMQIAAVVAYVRGCIRTGGKARLSADESLIPESLVIPATDYLRFNLLTRYNLEPNDARQLAYEKACLLFDEIRKGDYIPESGDVAADAADAASNDRATAPATGRANPEKRLLD